MSERTAEKDGKKRALDLALTQIEKQFGKGAIMKLGGTEVLTGHPGNSYRIFGIRFGPGNWRYASWTGRGSLWARILR